MSSPVSFMTARQTPKSSASTPRDITSSPLSSVPPSSAVPIPSPALKPLRKPFFRPAKPLSYELRNHSAVYLEDGQYIEAFTLLNNLLVSSTSISTPEKPHQAFIPPPQHLALAATLIVYPSLTTKAKSLERQKGSNAALQYLRNVSKTVDPLSDNFLVAFTFPTLGSTRRGGRNRGAEPESPDSDSGERSIKTNVANAASLWARAEDFWHIVGWAFNCSIAWKKRWERWKLWLEVMLDFMEAEWVERLRWSGEGGADVEAILTQSLIWHYISSQDAESRASRRRILRAILADGSVKHMKEFTEVFKNETKEKKQEEENLLKEQKALDIENGEFGDYDVVDDDEDAIMEDAGVRASSRPMRRAAIGNKNTPNISDDSSENEEERESPEEPLSGVERLGGIDALVLRQRLLALLAQVSQALPKLFTSVEDLFDLYTEFIRPLHTSIFGALLSTSKLLPATQTALNTNLLLPLLATNLPNYNIISPTQSHLEQYFLPFPATTHSYADNAKVSIVLEAIFTHMMNDSTLQPTRTLRAAMEDGIRARDNKALVDGRKKKGNVDEEEIAKGILGMSKARLIGLLELVEMGE
ncbi:hypothetical protein AOQ84DRAFT_346645 [Glonium stellatum]|uniref:Uncharacterized protein n=1 Tax=Glonium stellatum TaxID=574774 RepID=A0A8E2ESL4_9PEZI|nr:hypothetical protein AOQ84DRAFT_346645 [Glonium stellatum]